MATRPKLTFSFNEIKGTKNADTLSGAYGRINIIHGGDGDDTITGGNLMDVIYGDKGSDTIHGGSGNDVIYGGAGKDVIDGGEGDDAIYALNDGDTINGGAGYDTLDYSLAAKGVYVDMVKGRSYDAATGAEGDSFTRIERIVGSDHDDMIVGGHGNDTLEGGKGNDWIAGGAGSDHLIGGDGDDVLVGYIGVGNPLLDKADILEGGAGNDILQGDGGGDQLYGDEGDDMLFGGAGADLLHGGEGIDTAIYVGPVTVDLLAGKGYGGEAQGDALIGIENIHAGDQDDRLYGGNGANGIVGGGGSDLLDGRGGKDVLQGGAGRDTIIGGAGADELWGNQRDFPGSDQARDIFVYNQWTDSYGLAMDRIMDFDSTSTLGRNDLIDLRAIDANPQLFGDQAFKFIGDADFTSVGQVQVRFEGGDTIVRANIFGNLVPELVIRVEGLHQLDASDFLL